MKGPELAHLEPAEASSPAPVPVATPRPAGTDNLASYLMAGGSILCSSVLCLFLRPVAALEDLAMVHLLGIVLLSMWCSVGLSLVAAGVMVLTFDYVFVPPSFGFAESEFTYSLTFIVMILVAGVVSGLQQRFRREERAAREAAFHAQTLYGLEKELSTGSQSQARMHRALRSLEVSFESRLALILEHPSSSSQGNLTREQLCVAERAFGRLELSRDSTNAAAGVWAPLVVESRCLGVLGLLGIPAGSQGRVGDDLFQACASRVAISLESTQLGEAARRSELAAETERMRSSLLSAVSHDLKTPLSSILAAGTTLLERRAELDEQAVDELLSAVVLETERLSRLVHDLLSITRLESNAIVLRKSAESIEEIVTVAVQRLRAQGVERVIHCDFGKALPLVLVDPTLIEQVVINLMTNAVRYAGPASPIDLNAAIAGDQVLVRVQDRGPGVLPGERSRVFDKFYRSPSATSADGGIGLGLTICRAIVTAHGGTIAIAEREGGGASVEFTLPALTTAPEPLRLASSAP